MKAMGRRAFWLIVIIGLIGLSIGCGEEDSNPNLEQPNIEAILKDMVLIPAGEFLMGSSEGEGAYDEHPQHKVYLDDYYIDKYEVTNAQFQKFVEATGYITDAERKGKGEVWNPIDYSTNKKRYFNSVNWRCPSAWKQKRPHPDSWKSDIAIRMDNFDAYVSCTDNMNYPVVQVSWNDAKAYAAWVGKRLPTEAEWEKAARGNDSRLWSWGNVFDLNVGGVTVHTNIATDSLVPVNSFPTGISSYSVYNLAGNVAEWVADWYAPDYYSYSPKKNPKGPDKGDFHVLRGGSWRHQKSYHVLSTTRAYQVPDYSSNFVGFRCAWSNW